MGNNVNEIPLQFVVDVKASLTGRLLGELA